MSRIIHFEIPAQDPQRCMDFYKTVFGWEFNQWGDQAYWLTKTGEDEIPGINGAIGPAREGFEHAVNTVSTTNVDDTALAIENNGGAIIMPKMAVPTVGWLIYFKDPEGNLHGAMQFDPNAK